MWRASSYQPNSIYTFTSRFRFDETDFTLRRLEIEARANFDRWNTSLLYGNYAAQPAARLPRPPPGHPRHQSSVKVDPNWVVTGAARYDIEAGKFDQTRFGLGYIDDCFMLSLNYITNYTLQRQCPGQPYGDAADEPADARRTGGPIGCARFGI